MVKHARSGSNVPAADLAVLPLRVFLSAVYLDGGISKIADHRFLDPAYQQSMHAAVVAARTSSPIGHLLGPVQAHSTAFGVLLAIAEIAVGLGTLFGLFARVAAGGGMLLALSLWLTVSWNASPWFTSADVVYLVAFTPLLIAGAGIWSLDTWLATAPVEQQSTRRVVITGAITILGSLILGGAALARRGGPRRASDAGQPISGGQPLIAAANVPVGAGVQVTDARGDPVWVLQLRPGAYTAYDARCPHQGCTVRFVSARDGFVCPCHRSHFTPRGGRIDGPAPRGLTPIRVRNRDGQLRTE